ncbi:hypothetical protein DICPUDRAFT_88270 [Dictyostelium purpureum]|uniref:ABM domain-containing protein n=1 Tax=Dictyostelium purpureum TaxID=5786 RepID=F0ZNC6_DICPU|nr:uncharacterized protein DICPUDRAFT_88270 [Dictyostelium purpureum]EGC34557.1 hypothetical protein DICPUDRAFT_88270 [Dictyostelium purpureum]|eukprot:XP_003288933.1 hypothetical protein DICPUDRAFT_88270 [Dictyostelium purpureum]
MNLDSFAKTPKKDYFVCIFTSQKPIETNKEYSEMDIKMDELAKSQPGYLGVESTSNNKGFGITVSYWESLESIKNWKSNSEHMAAQQYGIKDWYNHYEIRVAEVKYSYSSKPKEL